MLIFYDIGNDWQVALSHSSKTRKWACTAEFLAASLFANQISLTTWPHSAPKIQHFEMVLKSGSIVVAWSQKSLIEKRSKDILV